MGIASGYLRDCPSEAHRAVAGALRYNATGLRTPEILRAARNCDAMAFAEIAQSHYIDTALETAFRTGSPLAEAMPDDLGLFFREMAAANARRNAALLEQLTEIAAAMERNGITCVALKGAVELLEPWWDAPNGRYLSDLDLLVPEDQIEAAHDVMRAVGASSNEPPDFVALPHHHLPAYTADHWIAQVELHRRIGMGDVDALMPAKDVIANARPTDIAGVCVPSPTHRLVHLIAHSQLAGGRHLMRRVLLRDLTGAHFAFAKMAETDIAVAERIFSDGGFSDLWTGYRELTHLVFGPDDAIATTKWARRALRRFGNPKSERWLEGFAWAAHYARVLLSSKERQRHYGEGPAKKRSLSDHWRFHKRRNRLIR